MMWQQGWQTLEPVPGVFLDVFCALGDRPGKVVLVSAGVHGDEYEGPAAVEELVAELQARKLTGTVIGVPVMNPSAFSAGTRTNPCDGLNLARCFPGNRDGKPTERWAAAVFEGLAVHADYLIDLHSGGVDYLFVPLAGFYGDAADENPSYDAARHFGLPCVWQLPETPGVLSFEMHSRGAVVIGNEYLGAGQLAAAGVLAYKQGLLNCLSHWGFLRNHPRELTDQVVLKGNWQLSASSGLFRGHKQLGDLVRRGELIASVVDVRGSVMQEFHASDDGMVAALRSKAFIRSGDWAVLAGAIAHV